MNLSITCDKSKLYKTYYDTFYNYFNIETQNLYTAEHNMRKLLIRLNIKAQLFLMVYCYLSKCKGIEE